jgi:hypothetical protein
MFTTHYKPHVLFLYKLVVKTVDVRLFLLKFICDWRRDKAQNIVRVAFLLSCTLLGRDEWILSRMETLFCFHSRCPADVPLLVALLCLYSSIAEAGKVSWRDQFLLSGTQRLFCFKVTELSKPPFDRAAKRLNQFFFFDVMQSWPVGWTEAFWSSFR